MWVGGECACRGVMRGGAGMSNVLKKKTRVEEDRRQEDVEVGM